MSDYPFFDAMMKSDTDIARAWDTFRGSAEFLLTKTINEFLEEATTSLFLTKEMVDKYIDLVTLDYSTSMARKWRVLDFDDGGKLFKMDVAVRIVPVNIYDDRWAEFFREREAILKAADSDSAKETP